MDILRSLGQLFLGSVPTIVIVLLFYLFLRWAFFTPIQRAMAERDARIEGAQREAASIEATAKQEEDHYHEAMRKARGEIYAEQEAARQEALQSRAKLLKAMRARAQEELANAKRRIQAELEAARRQVERDTPVLAGEIVRRILEKSPPNRPGAAR
jgi:F-type H+-transporting ATPase subunit b